jgi:polysaccharide chain length determinant protein (PEP-CTERM system associated)
MSDEFLVEQKQQAIDWRHALAVARRRIWYFLPAFFGGWLLVWSASWLMPSVYRSGTLILVEQPTVPSTIVPPNIAGNLQERLQSITQQILSRTRLLRISDRLNLYPRDRQRMAPDDLVERMRKDIEIELVRDNRNELTAFNIYFSAKDPHVAQQVTSELSNLFISENLEARQQQSENTTAFLESQLEEARKSLAEQEQEVREFKDKYLGELPGQLQSNLQILSGLQSQLQGEEDALNRAKQQSTYYESLLGQYRTLQRTSKTADGAPIDLSALDRELDRLKAQLTDLSSHYTDRHPDVRKVKEQIAKTERMKQQISAELASTGSSLDSPGTAAKEPADIRGTSPIMELQSQLKANQIEIANRQRRTQELQARVAEYQARLNQAPVREQQLTDLTRGYDQSKANYDALLKKKNDSELATNLERRQEGEHFRILDPPSLPQKPFSPNRLKLCAIGLGLGLFLGIGVSAGAELVDDRIYSEKEFKEMIPATVIAEIPVLPTPQEEASKRRNLWSVWVAGGLVFVLIAVGSTISYLRG